MIKSKTRFSIFITAEELAKLLIGFVFGYTRLSVFFYKSILYHPVEINILFIGEYLDVFKIAMYQVINGVIPTYLFVQI